MNMFLWLYDFVTPLNNFSILVYNNTINPIQAGVFWNHIVPPLRFSFICCPVTTKLGMIVLWHKISQGQ